jgi:hypothetical protein
VGSVGNRFHEANLFNWFFFISSLDFLFSRFLYLFCRSLRSTEDTSFGLSLGIEGDTISVLLERGGLTSCE